MMNKFLACCFSLLVITGCGGGGSGSSGGARAPAANSAPTISNPGSLSVAEGETAITTVSASDSNGDALSYSLSGGDSALFTISDEGVLEFRAAPSYNTPADANQDNVYNFAVNVTDGQATTSREIIITVVESLTDFAKGIFQDAAVFKDLCGDPRSGTDPFDGSTYPDQQGSFADENNWIRSSSNDLYLWYNEIEDVDPGAYASSAAQVLDYFDLMKTFATTPSGAAKDQYHFTYDSLEWKQRSQSGISVGYGVEWRLLQSSPPRKIVVAFVEPESPASAAGLARGAEIVTADGVDVVNGADTDTLNAAFWPESSSQSHSFEVLDRGSDTPRAITMTATEVTTDPVQNVGVVDTADGPVGYLTFNTHIATAEQELIDAITTLKDSNVTDLVLDLRYNSGGYLDIANQLAYMIAGPNATSGRTFSLQQFNDKHPSVNPVTGAALAPRTFHSTGLGFSASDGVALPHLDLSRVYVLTTSGTCSASEAIMNGLRGIDIEVIQIGGTTCGKPYGFYGLENCGTTYFFTQFKGVNAKGYGDYSDGFSPSNLATVEGEPIPGCAVDDDLSQPLGDANEAMLGAALAYRENGTCPALPSGFGHRASAPAWSRGLGTNQLPGMIIQPTFAGGLAVP
jgi:hypothetical protein